jgi:hypothetical protein
VVTGHDETGRAIIRSDSVEQGERFTLVWTTQGFPVDNTGSGDGARRDVGITLPGGSVFRIGEIAPGGRSPMHRTNSVDYGIVLEGELDMEVDGGDVVHLKGRGRGRAARHQPCLDQQWDAAVQDGVDPDRR